jgi:hypothetical protein
VGLWVNLRGFTGKSADMGGVQRQDAAAEDTLGLYLSVRIRIQLKR